MKILQIRFQKNLCIVTSIQFLQDDIKTITYLMNIVNIIMYLNIEKIMMEK